MLRARASLATFANRRIGTSAKGFHKTTFHSADEKKPFKGPAENVQENPEGLTPEQFKQEYGKQYDFNEFDVNKDGRVNHEELMMGWERRFGGQGSNFPDFIHNWSPQWFIRVGTAASCGLPLTFYHLGVHHTAPYILTGLVGLYWHIGYSDMKSLKAVRRNFPVIGNLRYIFETVRPEIRQYFIEGDNEAVPYSRANRSMAYQRAKSQPDSQSFGTRRDVYSTGYEWINHSMYPTKISDQAHRVRFGESRKQPYSASLLNISAMSYGALSDNAILALNSGAKLGNFFHNTGEGGVSRFHLKPGGDIVWNVGTGYFGCRAPDGGFCPDRFKDTAAIPAVKMIEIKLSQGAKPGHGGMLPKSKITPAIAEARGIAGPGEVGFADCNSPPAHSAFQGPRGLVEYIARLRELSDGKPVGFKLCMGRPEEFMAIIHAMVEMQVTPDFITIDGGEGGTGAAPPEFSNSVGTPLIDGLGLVNNALIGAGLRDEVRIIASGRVLSGMSVVRNLALGADTVNAARAMMFALGCIQALQCNTNKCPTGIATQDQRLMGGLHVQSKMFRVKEYHRNTVHAAIELCEAAGLNSPGELRPDHIMKRISPTRAHSMAELYPRLAPGCLLQGQAKACAEMGGVPLVEAQQWEARFDQYWNMGKVELDRF